MKRIFIFPTIEEAKAFILTEPRDPVFVGGVGMAEIAAATLRAVKAKKPQLVVLAGIAGYAASSCFGVKGMTIRSMSDGLAHLLGLENQSRGVKVTEAVDGGVNIDLHIEVAHGVNIATVCRSIIGEVRYHVERLTGVDVKNVDIYVESIKAD